MLTFLALLAIACIIFIIIPGLSKAQQEKVVHPIADLNTEIKPEIREAAKQEAKRVLDVNKDNVINIEDAKKIVKNVKGEAGRVKRKYGSRTKKTTKINSETK